ncbi:pitrilysin family protein [Coraliomargarita sp. SDUM461004]|uniref:Pitrilysin family protein n=1 Tax=Thalassobacterium sedimentorum TaxID=3041258 RepID=A0ABU1AQW2_9BACT|nr:pitrilysin family protein [Coraliomargarita sp. SDUM461004]MDQ8195998.1 pitrilysin family protein [Coraliomargarita sp. SDUM461004]
MKFLTIPLIFCLIALHSFAQSIPDGIQSIRTLGGIEEYRLESNGLNILLMPNEGLPVATVMVTYKVGSRNEVTGTTGATHILEHMMFKGTERFNSVDGNDYSSQMERIGARSNATTWFDRTNYYATMPSEYVPMTIELEADRMRGLLIREEDLASEMTVVRNEYERGENSPVSTLIKELFASAYMAHPYSHPTIGWHSDIESTTTEKLREFYDTYYWPENAVLTIIGGFNKAETLEAIVTHYGKVPAAPHTIPAVTTSEPEQLGARRVTIHRAGQVGVVMIGFKVAAGTHEDWAALTLLQQLLGADKTGRLYRALEDKGKASATFTYAPQLRDPGLFIFGAYLTPDSTHQEVENIILDEIDALISGGVDKDELARAKSVIQASTVYGRDGPYAIADQINEAIAMGDWTAYLKLPNAIQQVSTDALQKVAAKYFINQSSTTGWFIPEVVNSLTAQATHITGPNYFRDPALFGPLHNKPTTTAPTKMAAQTRPIVDFSTHMQQAQIGGIRLVAIDMPIDNVVSFVGSIAAGDSLSPANAPMLASLTAAMLDKGTTSQDRFKIAEKLDTLGADISFSSGAQNLNFAGQFLRPDAGSVLEILADQLRNPAFDASVLDNLKRRQEAGLLQAIDNPDYRASAQLSRLLYPTHHINYSTPIKELLADLKSTTIEDLSAFHQAHYGADSMTLIFTGDIDFEQLKAAVANAFEDWNTGSQYPKLATKQLTNQQQSERIYIEDKTSVAVRFGYNTELQRTAEDYLPFMVGNYILGGSFHSRLMTEVRKNRGLTYSIRSGHEGDILTPGNWILSASFAPSMLNQGLQATHEVLQHWYSEGVTEQEVSAAIETLTGSYLVGLSTTGSVAAQVHSFMQRGFEPEYIDQYPELVRQLHADDVNRTIQEYFDPTQLTEVIAGSLHKNDPQKSDLADPMPITVRLDVPDAGWRIHINSIYRTNESIIVLSELSRDAENLAAQVISTASDTANIALDEIDLPIRHYITGKTWDWGDTGEYTFIDSPELMSDVFKASEQLFQREK